MGYPFFWASYPSLSKMDKPLIFKAHFGPIIDYKNITLTFSLNVSIQRTQHVQHCEFSVLKQESQIVEFVKTRCSTCNHRLVKRWNQNAERLHLQFLLRQKRQCFLRAQRRWGRRAGAWQ